MLDLRHEAPQKTVQDFVSLYEDGHLELNPVFQRDSVWTERDRAKLIDSIVRNYPLPAIFLYRRHENGELIFDVIDGKGRIESILTLTNSCRLGWSAKEPMSNCVNDGPTAVSL